MSEQHKLTPIIGTVGTDKLYNWNGWKIVAGHGKSALILDEIQYRRRKVKQNMIIIVGPPGEGKSYFALRLAEILDKKFNPYKQIVFERTHLLWLLGPTSPLKMGQVIAIDEAQFIAGARRWYEDIQKDVMEHIESIRSRGFVIIIVALHLNLLDKIIRQYVLSHMMLMMGRGKAKIYHLSTPPFKDVLYKKTLGKMLLQLPSFEKCAYPNCLICKFIDKCMTNRAIYERLKREFLAKMSIQSQQKAAMHERRRQIIDFNDILKKVVEHKDKMTFSQKGVVEPESIRLLLEEQFGLILTDTVASRLIRRGKIKYPEIFKQTTSK